MPESEVGIVVGRVEEIVIIDGVAARFDRYVEAQPGRVANACYAYERVRPDRGRVSFAGDEGEGVLYGYAAGEELVFVCEHCYGSIDDIAYACTFTFGKVAYGVLNVAACVSVAGKNGFVYTDRVGIPHAVGACIGIGEIYVVEYLRQFFVGNDLSFRTRYES